MTTQRKIEIAFAALLLVAALVAANAWKNEIAARAALEATLKTEQAGQAELKKQAEAVANDLKFRLNALEIEREAAKTPEQQAAGIVKFAQLPQPIIFPALPTAPVPHEPPQDSSLELPQQAQPPHPAPAVANDPSGAGPFSGTGSHGLDRGVVLPPEDVAPLYDYAADCEECKVKLAAWVAQQNLKDEEIASLTRERDQAVSAVKGGTFWQRVKHDAKTIAISAAAGAVVGIVVKR